MMIRATGWIVPIVVLMLLVTASPLALAQDAAEEAAPQVKAQSTNQSRGQPAAHRATHATDL